MSVYTLVSQTQLDDFLQHYNVGKCVSYSGIEAGVENTNFFVSTTTGEYVLTLYEELTHEQLPFFLGLLDHLSNHNIPTVTPVPRINNEGFIGTLSNKPAALVERIPGCNIMDVGVEHCAIIGEAIADVHMAAQSFPGDSCRSGHRDEALQQINQAAIFCRLQANQVELLKQELEYYEQLDMLALPRGIIHSDLFRDNCLFTQNESPQLSGIIDFYYANQDAWLYDLAIIANDWCFDAQGKMDNEKHQALLHAYHVRRPLTELEIQQWPNMLRVAALYFWVYRLLFNLFPRQGETIAEKDAGAFQGILEWHVQHQTENQITVNSLVEKA